MSSNIFVLLYYKFVAIADPKFETVQHKLVCNGIGLKGRIIISEEGINGTVAGTSTQLRQYVEYMNEHPYFKAITFKRSTAGKLPFAKLIVKYRPEIVTLGKKVDIKKVGKYLKPEQMHQLFEKGEDMVVVDMRNNYEYEVGRFEGAIQPDTAKFYELPEKIKNLKLDKNKKVVTYCTGGIRCEKATALLAEEGFTDVYQLEGGIVKYLEEYPDGYFKGKNFVFDERMITNADTESGQSVLGKCAHCKKPNDRYTDCAKPDCHQLFICCKDCDKKHSGLCPVALKGLSKKT
ncbi:rhodanese-related sulfurtransferase [Candidatus Saccharibacteria bacterium]|nr:rhodanese-related sulfurtransferase [Candidatus Saccharibacteria bacterium]